MAKIQLQLHLRVTFSCCISHTVIVADGHQPVSTAIHHNHDNVWRTHPGTSHNSVFDLVSLGPGSVANGSDVVMAIPSLEVGGSPRVGPTLSVRPRRLGGRAGPERVSVHAVEAPRHAVRALRGPAIGEEKNG